MTTTYTLLRTSDNSVFSSMTLPIYNDNDKCWSLTNDAGSYHIAGSRSDFSIQYTVPNPPLTLTVNSITSDAANTDTIIDFPNLEVTVPQHSTLNVWVQLTITGTDSVYPLTQNFRTVLVGQGVPNSIALTKFVNGYANISTKMTTVGEFTITQESINSTLAANAQMKFNGATIYVYS